MKAIHRSRIDGLLILSMIVGVIAGKYFGWTALILAIPVILLWLFEYDINSNDPSDQTIKGR